MEVDMLVVVLLDKQGKGMVLDIVPLNNAQ